MQLRSVFVLLLLSFKVLNAQFPDECGMINYSNSIMSTSSTYPPINVGLGNYTGKQSLYVIPLEFVIIAPSNCENNSHVKEIKKLIRNQEIPGLQRQFGKHNICFSVLGIKTICSDSLYSSVYYVEDIHDHAAFLGYDSNVVTVFIIKDLRWRSRSGDPSGVASSIGDIPAFAFVEDTTIIQDLKVTAHEIGHCLGLRHVFAGYCEASKKEYVWTHDINLRLVVSNNKCATTGDYVCDTYPVPLKNMNVNWQTCKWKNKDSICGKWYIAGTGLVPTMDSLWTLFNSDTCPVNHLCNTMGYVPGIYCRKGFTEGQGARMRWFLDNKPIGRLIYSTPANLPVRQVSGITYSSGWDSLYYLYRLEASNITVNPNAYVEFSAGYSVVLKPPFHVKPGAKFHAYISKKCPTPPRKIKTFPGISINIGGRREALQESSHKLDDVEAFPSVVTAGSPVYVRLIGELQDARVTIFWTFTDGSTRLALESTKYKGESIHLNAPQQAGLYRLTIVVEGHGSYEVKSVPIIVY